MRKMSWISFRGGWCGGVREGSFSAIFYDY